MQSSRLNKLLIVVGSILGVLIIVNILFLDWWFFSIRKQGSGSSEEGETKENLFWPEKVATDSCGLVCQKVIEEKIQEELARMPSLAGQSSVLPTVSQIKPSVVPTTSQSRVIYIPLVTSGTVSSISWTDIVPSEFYFDLVNYPGAKEVRFEAYLLSLNNDLIFARLYDVTNKRGVDFSDLQTNSSSFTRVESSAMKIWQGNNKYTVQLRSVNATQAQLKDAKFKIMY